MKCQRCGIELPEGANFCRNCGAVQSASAADAVPAAPEKKKSRIPLILGLSAVALGLLIAIIAVAASRGKSAVEDTTVMQEPMTSQSEEAPAQTQEEPTESTADQTPEEESGEKPGETPEETPSQTSESGETPVSAQSDSLPDGSHSEVPDSYIGELEAFISSSDQNLWWNQVTVSAGGTPKTLESAEYYQNFFSYDTSIATVASNGIVTGVAPGTTYIVADKGTGIQPYVFKVIVEAQQGAEGQTGEVQSTSLPDGSHSEVPEDCLPDLEAFIYGSHEDDWWNLLTVSAGGTPRTLESAEYYQNFYSYDTSIATVKSKGIVTGVAPGTTYVVADKGTSPFGRVQVHVFKVTVE